MIALSLDYNRYLLIHKFTKNNITEIILISTHLAYEFLCNQLLILTCAGGLSTPAARYIVYALSLPERKIVPVGGARAALRAARVRDFGTAGKSPP
jgi:hypothetical protein